MNSGTAERGVRAKGHGSRKGLNAACRYSGSVDRAGTGDRQTGQAADGVVTAVTQHCVSDKGQRVAACTGHCTLRCHHAAGQRGVLSQAERAAVGLTACARHPIGTQRGCTADAQVIQASHRIGSGVPQHCTSSDAQ